MAWLFVALGGAIGACSRYSRLGCFAMGVGFALIVEREFVNQELRQLLLVGLLGALTTFSTFAIESLTLLQNQQYKMACIYISGSMVITLLACLVGLVLGRMIMH